MKKFWYSMFVTTIRKVPKLMLALRNSLILFGYLVLLLFTLFRILKIKLKRQMLRTTVNGRLAIGWIRTRTSWKLSACARRSTTVTSRMWGALRLSRPSRKTAVYKIFWRKVRLLLRNKNAAHALWQLLCLCGSEGALMELPCVFF